MKKLFLSSGILSLAAVAIVVGCSENSDSPSQPLSIQSTAQSVCGEAEYLSQLSPVLAVWEDSIEAWRGSDLLNSTPAFSVGADVGAYLNALVPVLQQWEDSINASLGSAVLDTVPNFNLTTSSRQDYLAQLSALLVTWKQDLDGARGSVFLPAVPVFQRDNIAPELVCPEDTTILCVGVDSLAIVYNVTAVDDCDPSPVLTCTPPSGSKFPIGATTVTCTAVDSVGNSSTCSFTVTLTPAEPPVITSLTVSPNQLWPPNHRWVNAEVSVQADSPCGEVTCRIMDVTSNEEANAGGSGNTSSDWMITGDKTLQLRAERSGKGSGRVYTIRVRCEVTPELFDEATVDVVVPHDRGKKGK